MNEAFLIDCDSAWLPIPATVGKTNTLFQLVRLQRLQGEYAQGEVLNPFLGLASRMARLSLGRTSSSAPHKIMTDPSAVRPRESLSCLRELPRIDFAAFDRPSRPICFSVNLPTEGDSLLQQIMRLSFYRIMCLSFHVADQARWLAGRAFPELPPIDVPDGLRAHFVGQLPQTRAFWLTALFKNAAEKGKKLHNRLWSDKINFIKGGYKIHQIYRQQIWVISSVNKNCPVNHKTFDFFYGSWPSRADFTIKMIDKINAVSTIQGKAAVWRSGLSATPTLRLRARDLEAGSLSAAKKGPSDASPPPGSVRAGRSIASAPSTTELGGAR